MRLEGRIALVTGGTGGIGSATCARLAAEGARVAVADLDLDRARELAGELDGLGVELDVRSRESARAAVAAIEAELGPVDVLVNNAGIADDDFFVRSTEDQWDRLIAVNLRGVLAVTHAVLPGMQERNSGSIVNVASEAGRVGSQVAIVYSATKGGVIGFTKALAKETARYGVRVNAVAPGPDRHADDARAPSSSASSASGSCRAWSSPRPCAGRASPTRWPPRSPTSPATTPRS